MPLAVLSSLLAILAFGAGPALAAGPLVLESESASSITSSTVTLEGTLNPAGSTITACEFEYASEAAYQQALVEGAPDPYEKGAKASCVAPLPGAVETSEPVKTSPIAGLELNTTYHYRLTATSIEGTEAAPDQTFTTSAVAPAVNDQHPFVSNVTQFTATLNATIDPGNAVVNYHFEYGTSTAYGSIAPIPDGYTPVNNSEDPVSQAITGLTAGTTYHYRLLASSPGGTNITGPDETFTTLPIPAPSVGTGGSSGIGVGSATLSGSIDPHGWDTTYLFQYGTSTTYGQSWPTVPVDMGALEGAQPVVVSIERLLPSTIYHYRLLATNGGGTEYGADQTFTTGEYPISVIQQAPPLTPAVAFPTTSQENTGQPETKKLTKTQQLSKALKAGYEKKRAKRAKCEKQADSKYGKKSKTKK